MEELELIYKAFREGSRVTTDSREVKEGDIFIALKGENHNGNTFAEKAIAQGARHVVIDEAEYNISPRCVLVPDTLRFLQQLAHHHRQQLNIPILGITGTNGKTTTKELCHAVLSKKYKTVATKGNLNNHIGVPLTLLSMDADTEFGIVEMGANHPGEIKDLCEIAEPDYGIITNIGYAHLEGFGSYENIIETKSALYKSVMSKEGILFVNSQDELLCRLSEESKRFTYGMEGTLANGEIAQTTPYLVYTLKTRHGHLYIRTKLIGGYNFDNAMAASAVGTYFEVDPLQIQAAMEAYTPSNLRSQLLKTERNTIILDAYNANLSSMRVAISNFAEMKADDKLVIIGEMRELGAISNDAHREIMDLIASHKFPKVFVVGHNFESFRNKYTFTTYFPDTEALIEYLKTHEVADSFILVKGSRGNKLERIIDYL
ncbi:MULTISPECIES: UDP-N-acetylmuramoyl-tripeptide--D-alanyl-D-alanine ligase [Butyricimonas]|uniref:UDP-N-acetylmuramoyl-tripeptide--D-alanyl-D- alanine ligase n=1 Tax=Butyricimonas TaxID=574697 RepID=UPI0007FB3243|nr:MULTISPECIES: UDP-N-acetylmuramoyl-tripeptide--D-alanyl-D-alanine ligase [Butyricimonas]